MSYGAKGVPARCLVSVGPTTTAKASSEGWRLRLRPNTRDGEEAEGAETAPISEVMQRSGMVISEDAPVAEAEQVDAEEIESEDDYSVVPSKPSHLEFGKSTITEGDMTKLMKLGYFSETKRSWFVLAERKLLRSRKRMRW
jgi:hypothetical protein